MNICCKVGVRHFFAQGLHNLDDTVDGLEEIESEEFHSGILPVILWGTSGRNYDA